MTNELANKKQEKYAVSYQSGGQTVDLSPSIVNQFVTKGNAKITGEEAVNFIKLCQYAQLNPFLNEAYIIKFGSQPAQLITSKEAFMKRAERQKSYDGFDAGVVVVTKNGELVRREGSIVLKSEELVGGWAKVYREDRNRPTTVEINFEEFAKYKQDGKTLQATWQQQPANMIRKSALVNALREAYPDQLGAMYTEDDKSPQEVAKQVEEAEKNDEVTNSLIDGFKSQNEPAEYADFEEVDEGEELLKETEEVIENDELFEGNTTNPKSE